MKPTKAAFYYHNLKTKLFLFLRNPHFMTFYWNRFQKYTGLDSFESFIISYPKSGRTWLQKMIIEAVKLEGNKTINLDDVSNLKEYFPDFPLMLSTHASSSWEEIVHDEQKILKEDLDQYIHGKIIYLYRDPRDVLVSQFYHMTLRSGFTSLKKEEMLFSENVGIRKIVNFMNKWLKFANSHPNDIYSISYEGLKKDPIRILTELFEFLEYNISLKNIEQAIENTTLKKMQEKETASSSTPWSSTKSNETNAFQSRKGIVGEFQDFFNDYEIEILNKIIDEELDSAYNYN